MSELNDIAQICDHVGCCDDELVDGMLDVYDAGCVFFFNDTATTDIYTE